MRVRRGKIKKEPCVICTSIINIESHHPDYSQPDWVIWLCRKCHKGLHKNEKFEQIVRNNPLWQPKSESEK